MEQAVAKSARIILDHSEVEDLSTETLVLLLAHIETYERLYKHFNIEGVRPKSERARRLLLSSGFTKFMSFSAEPAIKNSDIFEIHRGSQVEPHTASKFNSFALEKLRKEPSIASRRNYSMLIECMANTRNHAYQIDGKPIRKWWLVAQYDAQKQKMRFSFLDLGVGIPKTVRKKFSELVTLKSDSRLIDSALRGNLSNLRTSTGLPHRGKGLPRILNNLKSNFIQNLAIMSNRGYLLKRSFLDKKM